MSARSRTGFEHALSIEAPPGRVLAAFFDARALAEWWDVATVIATPRPLGVYALEWRTSSTRDDLLGRYGGVLHGTVIDFHAAREFLVADCYWLPPDGDPIGPMSLEVSCRVEGAGGARKPTPVTRLHVAQRGIDEDNPRWVRYYQLLTAGWPSSLDRLRVYLEKGRGVWDLRSHE